MAGIRVLIVDDHTLFRESLRSLLDKDADIEVVGEAADGIEAVDRLTQLQPDVVLMDVAMPGINGLQTTRRMKKENPSVKVLALTMYETEQHVFEMLCAGAVGYVPKRASAGELISAIKAVYQGGVFLHPAIAGKVLDEYLEQVRMDKERGNRERLTARELEVLSLIAEGNTNKQIAGLLSISVATVQTHRLHLMRKLGAHDCAQLVRYAIGEGLITA